MLGIKSLSITYGKRTILENIDFEFQRGTITVIKGESGSGKSSLLNVLGLMQTAPNFEYIFDGKSISRFNDKERADFRLHHVGFVFQQSNLLQELTAVDNLIIPMSITSQDSGIRQKAHDLISFVGLEDVKNDYPSSMSGGEEQRLALARAMANDADIILADEPTAALDANNSKKILELFRKMAHELNKIVIVVSHSDFVCQYADVICEIKDKKLVATKTSETIASPEVVITRKRDVHKRKTSRFVLYYSGKRSTSKVLNGVFMVVTALVSAAAMLSLNFGANIVSQQDNLINTITDKSIFVVNDTMQFNRSDDYDPAIAITPDVIEQIASIPGISKVYPWYKFSSEGQEVYGATGLASIKVTDGDTVIAERSYYNRHAARSTSGPVIIGDSDTPITVGGDSPTIPLSGGEFVVFPMYDEEDMSYLLEHKSASEIASGLVMTWQLASLLSANPAELIDKRIEVACYVPTILYSYITQVTYGGSGIVAETVEREADIAFCKLVTFESSITGILPRSYSLSRAQWGLSTNYIFMNYSQFIDIIEQNKDWNIGARFPHLPEKELGPSALVVFVNTYEDVLAVTSEIEKISEYFYVANNVADVKAIQTDLTDTRNMLTVVTAVFIGIVAISFSMLYYLKNRARKKEIGILKAIGFTKANIAALISLEMLKMALPAFVLAVGLAFLLVFIGTKLPYSYDIYAREYLSITVSSILIGFLVCFVVVILSGIFPVYNASNTDPIEAIRKSQK